MEINNGADISTDFITLYFGCIRPINGNPNGISYSEAVVLYSEIMSNLSNDDSLMSKDNIGEIYASAVADINSKLSFKSDLTLNYTPKDKGKIRPSGVDVVFNDFLKVSPKIASDLTINEIPKKNEVKMPNAIILFYGISLVDYFSSIDVLIKNPTYRDYLDLSSKDVQERLDIMSPLIEDKDASFIETMLNLYTEQCIELTANDKFAPESEAYKSAVELFNNLYDIEIELNSTIMMDYAKKNETFALFLTQFLFIDIFSKTSKMDLSSVMRNSDIYGILDSQEMFFAAYNKCENLKQLTEYLPDSFKHGDSDLFKIDILLKTFQSGMQLLKDYSEMHYDPSIAYV